MCVVSHLASTSRVLSHSRSERTAHHTSHRVLGSSQSESQTALTPRVYVTCTSHAQPAALWRLGPASGPRAQLLANQARHAHPFDMDGRLPIRRETVPPIEPLLPLLRSSPALVSRLPSFETERRNAAGRNGEKPPRKAPRCALAFALASGAADCGSCCCCCCCCCFAAACRRLPSLVR